MRSATMSNGKQRNARRQLFPEKLWDLVNRPSSGIQWSPDGKRIEVERSQLEKFIGTKFRSHNFDSFIRQLHFYGFRKCGNSYHHDKFQRGQPEALSSMKRKYSHITLNPIKHNELIIPTENELMDSESIKMYTLLPSDDSVSNQTITNSNDTSIFTTIREDSTQAHTRGNSLMITIPDIINDSSKGAWPKTLVLESYFNGSQNILSAYFIYKSSAPQLIASIDTNLN